MKNLIIFAAALLNAWAIFASDGSNKTAEDLFNWNFLWLGSWEESVSTPLRGTLNNRADFKIDFLPLDITLRTQILDRRPLTFEHDTLSWKEIWGDPEKWITNLTMGLYHKDTGSRLLYGVLDEWGLPARIRNPWIRSPPYAENHNPVLSDIKTAASSTKEDEIYLYLNSPYIDIFQDVKFKGFLSFQTYIDSFAPALSGGLDFTLADKTNLLLEVFYTGKTLPPTKNNTWFTDPPPLPQRDFNLYSAGLLFTNPDFSISSDFAVSDIFAWGMDIYANLGVSFSPSLPIGERDRPLLISFAIDGSGERFVNRDGSILSEGFRNAYKIEWKGRYNELFRINTVLRGSGLNEDFNRSSTGFYYRFPSPARSRNDFFRFTRISLSAERNAVNPQKITDVFSGNFGFRLNMGQTGKKSLNPGSFLNNYFLTNNLLGVNLSGSIKLMSASENASFYPIFDSPWTLESGSVGCEFTWSPGIYQFRSKIGYTSFPEKDDKWDFSINASARIKQGRLSIKAASDDFPNRWNCGISWRYEIR
ncbi:MAG: hypothetical protein FWD24_02715 [Treponema sp.]|nr:hypothetical protein [Treponema sp.]